jgi:hypothetical protein
MRVLGKTAACVSLMSLAFFEGAISPLTGAAPSHTMSDVNSLREEDEESEICASIDSG